MDIDMFYVGLFLGTLSRLMLAFMFEVFYFSARHMIRSKRARRHRQALEMLLDENNPE